MNADEFTMENVDVFTVEEENLLCIFDTSSRAKLISELSAAIPDFDDPEMREIADNAMRKLNAMSDADFSAINLTPAYFDDESEV